MAQTLAALGARTLFALVLVIQCAVAADLRIAISAEPTSFDPHFHNLGPNNTIASHIFETLTRFDADQILRPGLAESWRLIDDTTWEFKLRKGVRFHDGSELTAEDVVASLDRPATIEKSPAPFTSYTRRIVAKEIVDPLTIRLKTAEPHALMPTDLTTIFIVSRKATQGADSKAFAAGRGTIGTGPYRFESAAEGTHVDLVRNELYWGEKPKWDRVRIRFITSDASRLAALLAGDVSAIDNVPPADLGRIRNDPNFSVFTKVSNRVIYLALDQGRDVTPFAKDKSGQPLAHNPFKDARVREAISKAINRQAIAEKTMLGLAVPAANLVPHPMFGHNAQLKVEPYDPQAARKLLADAGYPQGFALRIHGPNNRYVNDEQVLHSVAQMLTRIGIDASVEAMPAAVFFTRARNKEFSLALGGWGSQTGEVSSALRALLATIDPKKGMGAVNWGMYSNAKLDALLEEALRTFDDRRREALLREAVAIAVTETGLIPLHFQVVSWATRKGITYSPRSDERTLAQHFR